jgi:rhomboid family protein
MSQKELQRAGPESRLTPWVGRIMLANAAVFVLLSTVLTAPVFTQTLQFTTGGASQRPWTFLSYMFVHDGLLQLVANLLLLFVFGPPVERRVGGPSFVFYYLYCGVGSAAFALGLGSFMPLPPLLGSSGAVLGIALAFAFAWPDADSALTPVPLRIRARVLVGMLATGELVLALWPGGAAGNLGFLGGLVAGYFFLRLQSLAGERRLKEPRSVIRRPVMAPIPVRQGGTATEVRPALIRPEPAAEDPSLEVDRVLDKISAFGIQSLTADERRFLDEVAERKRKNLP